MIKQYRLTKNEKVNADGRCRLLKLWFLLSIFAMIVVIDSDSVIYAETLTSGDYEYRVLDDGTAEITQYNGISSSIQIPKTINGYSVTSIGEFSFQSCSSVTSVVIPNGIKAIGNCAFSYCSSLINITIPDSVEYIDIFAFGETPWLEEKFKNNNGLAVVNKMLIAVDDDLAGKCTVPDGVISIDDYVFFESNITSIIIPDSVTKIGEYAFAWCSSLESATLSNNITTISGSLFNGCSSLKSIIIPDSVREIGEYAFSGCSNLESVTLSNNITTISKRSFNNCSSLKSIIILNGVKEIGDHAFSGCSSLTNIIIPNSVKEIEDYAFSGCSSLTNITVPKGVSYIGYRAFENCSALNEVDIADGVYMYESAFCGCSSLEKFVVPKGNSKIGDSTFDGCSKLREIIISDGVISIGKNAFRDCKSLTEVDLPKTMNVIEDGAFSGCISLERVNIPKTVSNIGENVFSGCNSKLILGVEPGSYGEQYAGANNINVEVSGTDKISLDSADVKGIEPETYTGTLIMPDPKVTLEGKILTKDIDYTLEFPVDSENVGEKSMTIKGIGNYTGSKIVKYEIVPYNATIADAIWLKGVGTNEHYKVKYTGKNIKLLESDFTIGIKDLNNKVLKLGIDYDILDYNNNLKIGVASFKIVFKGNFTGTRTYQFEIVPPTPQIKSIKKNGKGLKLTWKKVSSADGYFLYRSMNKNGVYKKIATLKNNKTLKYTDKKVKKNKKYYYKLIAYKKCSNKVYISSDYTVKCGKR